MPKRRATAVQPARPRKRPQHYPTLSRNRWNSLVVSTIRQYLELDAKLLFAVALCSRIQTDYECQSVDEQICFIQNWLVTKVCDLSHWCCRICDIIHYWSFEVRNETGFRASTWLCISETTFQLNYATAYHRGVGSLSNLEKSRFYKRTRKHYPNIGKVVVKGSNRKIASLVCGFIYTKLLDSGTLSVSQKH